MLAAFGTINVIITDFIFVLCQYKLILLHDLMSVLGQT